MRELTDAGGLKIDAAAYHYIPIDRNFSKKTQSPAYTQRLREAGAKLSLDGLPQGFTAGVVCACKAARDRHEPICAATTSCRTPAPPT